MSKEVAKTENALPIPMDDMAADSGAGMESMGAQDIAMPFLAILQKMSGAVGEVPGANPGNFINTVDVTIFEADPGIEIVPCAYERKWVMWRDIDAGGGYLGDHPSDYDWSLDFEKDDKGRLRNKQDSDIILVETAYHYVLYRQAGSSDPFKEIVFPLKSTALKANRKLNKQISETLIPGTTKQAPRWLHSYTVTTTREEKGTQVWWEPIFTKSAEYVSAEVYEKAKQFYELFKANALTINPDAEQTPAVAPQAGRTDENGDEIPF
jgi:hypothetical protein